MALWINTWVWVRWNNLSCRDYKSIHNFVEGLWVSPNFCFVMDEKKNTQQKLADPHVFLKLEGLGCFQLVFLKKQQVWGDSNLGPWILFVCWVRVCLSVCVCVCVFYFYVSIISWCFIILIIRSSRFRDSPPTCDIDSLFLDHVSGQIIYYLEVQDTGL